MLYGGFAECNQPIGNQWSVALPEDNVSALRILLNIIHSRFDGVPTLEEAVTLEDLYQITVLTDKYDLTHIIRPWAGTWIDATSTPDSIIREMPNIERRLWIAWELGDRRLFEAMARDLVLQHENDIGLFCGTIKLFTTVLESSKIYDSIMATRLQMLEKLIELFRKAVNILVAGDTSGYGRTNWLCTSSQASHYADRDSREACEIMMLGSMTKSLSSVGLWTFPEPGSINMSISGLASALKSIKYIPFAYDHASCRPVRNADSAIDGILSNIKFALTESEVNHLEKQPKKSGLAY